MKPRILSPLWVGLVLLAVAAARGPAQLFEFSAMPPGTYDSVVVDPVDSMLVLDEDATGDFVAEGYFEMTLPEAFLSERMVQVLAQSMNSLVDGTFAGLGGGEPIRFYHPCKQDHEDFDEKASGRWFTDANAPRPSVVAFGDGHAVQINRQSDLEQFIAIDPGEDYRLEFFLDPTNLYVADGTGAVLEDQLFSVHLRFYDESFRRLRFRNPKNDAPIDQLLVMQDSAAEGARQVTLRLRTLESEDHLQYAGGDADHPDDVWFNFCSGATGDLGLFDYDYESWGCDPNDPVYEEEWRDLTAGDIRYVSVVFDTLWITADDGVDYNAYHAIIDDIRLLREDQVEVTLLDDDGTELQRSRLLTGFLSKDLAALSDLSPKRLRLTLRSHLPDSTPRVQAFRLFRAMRTRVRVGPTLKHFDEPRLGFTGFPPPKLEWYDSRLTYRTEVVDPFAGYGAVENLLEFLAEHGVARWRHALQASGFNVDWNGSELTMDLSEPDHDSGDPDSDRYRMDGATWIRRYQEMVDHGFEVLGLIEPDAFVEWVESPDDENGIIVWKGFWRDFGLGDAVTGEVLDDEKELLIELNEAFTRRLVELFSGSSEEELDDGEILVPPAVTHWQVLNEHNLKRERNWHRRLFTQEEHVAILNRLADTVRGYAPVVDSVSTSINGHGFCYDRDYFADTWTDFFQPSATDYTHLGVHCYLVDGCIPEGFSLEWPQLRRDYLPEDWRRKPLVVGEYGIRRHLYVPGCSTEWDRGYGMTLFARMVARLTLTHLELPAEQIHYYGPFSEAWKGGTIAYDPCWKSESWFGLFDRVPGYGLLGDADESTEDGCPDEPSRYEANEGGLAFLTLARHLSTSSPRRSRIRAPVDASDDERYHCASFTDSSGRIVVALWFYRDYEYGHEQTNYLTGGHDRGFEELRRHDVLVRGVHSSGYATLIHLDGQPDENIVAEEVTLKGTLLRDVVFGEMPVLICFAQTAVPDLR